MLASLGGIAILLAQLRLAEAQGLQYQARCYWRENPQQMHDSSFNHRLKYCVNAAKQTVQGHEALHIDASEVDSDTSTYFTLKVMNVVATHFTDCNPVAREMEVWDRHQQFCNSNTKCQTTYDLDVSTDYNVVDGESFAFRTGFPKEGGTFMDALSVEIHPTTDAVARYTFGPDQRERASFQTTLQPGTSCTFGRQIYDAVCTRTKYLIPIPLLRYEQSSKYWTTKAPIGERMKQLWRGSGSHSTLVKHKSLCEEIKLDNVVYDRLQAYAQKVDLGDGVYGRVVTGDYAMQFLKKDTTKARVLWLPEDKPDGHPGLYVNGEPSQGIYAMLCQATETLAQANNVRGPIFLPRSGILGYQGCLGDKGSALVNKANKRVYQ